MSCLEQAMTNEQALLRRLRYAEIIDSLQRRGYSKGTVALLLEVNRTTLFRRIKGLSPISAEALLALEHLDQRVG